MSFTKDAFRPDAGLKNDDWRLEYNLPKHLSDHSNFSYRSCSPDTVLDKGCKHRSLLYQRSYETCRQCGVYVSKNGVKSYKSEKMNFLAFFPSKTIYETLIKRSHSFKQSHNEEYIQLRLAYVDWIFELSGKFGLSNQSSHLAVFLLDFVMFKDPSLTQKIPLYAPTCLLLAAKTIELDQRIPFISKLKRYANSIHSIEEFKKAELHVLDLMDWNSLFTSSFELLEFLLCQGVIFSNDEVEESTSPLLPQKGSPLGLSENTQHENTNHLDGRIDTKRYLSSGLYAKENHENSLSEGSTAATNSENAGTPYLLISGRGISEEGVLHSPPKGIPVLQKHNSTPATSGGRLSVSKPSKLNEKKITKILENIESTYTKLANMVLKDLDFLQFEPKIISAGMLAFLRYTNKLVQIWNGELEVITGLQFSQVSPCFEIIYKKYASSFQIASPKPQNILNTIDSNQNRTPELRPSIGDKNLNLSSHKTSFLTDGYRKTVYAEPIIKSDYNSTRLSEKKTIFGSQGKSYIPNSHHIPYKLSAEPSYLSEYSYRSRPSIGESFGDNSFPNISRNPILQSNYQPSKLTSKNDYSSNYSGTTRTRVSENKYLPSSGFADLLSENRYPSAYSRLTARSTSTIESGIRGKYH